MPKLERKAHVLFVDSSFGKGSAEWFKVGKDIEDMSIDLGTNVETVENIWNETSVKDNGYTPQIEANPYYADASDSIYEPLRDIALERKKGADCETKYLEVIIEDTEATSHLAYQEDCVVKPTSYGGGTEGINIPFSISPNGNRKKGTVTFEGGVPTFSPSV